MPQLPFTFRSAVRGAPEDRGPPEPDPRGDPPASGPSGPKGAAPAGEKPAPAKPIGAASGPEDAPGPEPRPLTVTALNARLRRAVEASFDRLWVEGEVRRPTIHRGSGHAYFELADRRSSVPVMMAASAVRRLEFELRDGLHVLVEGEATVYAARGRLQLQVRRIEPVGEGALRLALEARVERLRREGLIDPARKKPLPAHPRPVGVVTSRSGAALRDVVRTALRRDPRAHVVLAAASVQGPLAAGEIVRALRRLDRAGCGVILLVRGGGSLEDLRPFNEEPVARAVAACRTPVVTGVGHETDTTLVDLVADARASTPTAAAELVVPSRAEVEARLLGLSVRLRRALAGRVARAGRDLERRASALPHPVRRIHAAGQALDELEARAALRIRSRLDRARSRLDGLERRLAAGRPEARLEAWRVRLEHLEGTLGPAARRRLADRRARLEAGRRALGPGPRTAWIRAAGRLEGMAARLDPALEARVDAARSRLAGVAGRLAALSPLAVLGRGYAVATREDGRAIRRASEVGPGDRVRIRVAEGGFHARVEE